MRRLISISMVAVLAGWLAMPQVYICDMKCCHRTTAVVSDCSHMEGMDTSGNAENVPEINVSSSACPGKCCVKGRSVQFGLAVPGFNYLFSTPQISPHSSPSLDVWLRADSLHASRAPPHIV